MGRENEPQTQKKPWSELTEEERNVIRESWKHKLPEEYDVFCMGDFKLDNVLYLPGNLYVRGNILSQKGATGTYIFVANNLWGTGDVHVTGVVVDENIYIQGNVTTSGFFVDGDAVIEKNLRCDEFEVKGLLDCYNFEVQDKENVSASDYFCRCLKDFAIRYLQTFDDYK